MKTDVESISNAGKIIDKYAYVYRKSKDLKILIEDIEQLLPDQEIAIRILDFEFTFKNSTTKIILETILCEFDKSEKELVKQIELL